MSLDFHKGDFPQSVSMLRSRARPLVGQFAHELAQDGVEQVPELKGGQPPSGISHPVIERRDAEDVTEEIAIWALEKDF